MSNLLVNTRDQQFVLFEQLGIEKLFESEAFKDFTKDDLLMIMKEAEKMAVNVLAPTLKDGDEEGCHLKDGKVSVPKCYREPYKTFCAGGWLNPMDSAGSGRSGHPRCRRFFQSGTFRRRQLRSYDVSRPHPRRGGACPYLRNRRAEEKIHA